MSKTSKTAKIIFIMAAAAMLNLLPVYFLTHFEDYGSKMCLHTKFHANRTIFSEVITFHKFSRWRPPRSRHVTSLFAILDHTRSRRGGPNLLFKFDFGILITFGYIAILVFCHFACKMANHAHFLVNFGGSYLQNLTLIILTPKWHILG